MSWAMVAVAAVNIGIQAYEYSSQPGPPKPPDLNAANREGIQAQAETLADRRKLEAAAEQGTSTTYQTAAQKGVKVDKQFVAVPSGGRQRNGQPLTKLVPYVASEWQKGGRYYIDGAAPPDIITKKVKVNIPSQTKTADFTGYGEADVQGKVARQNAANQLALEQKYGPQFIEEALKEEALANPEGVAARAKLADLINEQANAKPDRPVANLLDQQVADQLKAGKNLTGVSDDVLREAVAQSEAARGDRGGNPEQFSEPLTTGFEGQQRLTAAQQKALGWEASGATPEDVQYRRTQQTLANEGAFINGQTPENQFQQLSGAQTGAAPVVNGRPLPGQGPNAGPGAQNAALQTWNTQNQFNSTQANSWMAGLSALLHGAGALGSAGYKPLATSVGGP